MANRLRDALSPYLHQHAENPVAWWPWGPAALTEARLRDVPLLISVGYAACHWCHVMAHESFADPEIAELINARTVPVKVDREERPDIDAVYMQATVAMTGQGGWPMTVFADPNGSPFFAGTYFPREHLRRLLDAVHDAWTNRREEVLAQGEAVVRACATGGLRPDDVSRVCPVGGPCPTVAPVDAAVLDRAATQLRTAHDQVNGGFRGAPKFPTQPALAFLLAHHRRTGDPAALQVVVHTADRMARGGIHDQLGGGFARYSVDAGWSVPHFEKMLYDNALLLETFLDLTRLTAATSTTPTSAPTPPTFFGEVADGIAGFLVRELGTPEGGFASALDADTDGVEGSTYVWTPEQLVAALGPADGRWAAETFAVTDAGTFEAGASVLQLPAGPDDAGRFADLRARLLTARSQRPQPHRDDKVVAAWNGLAAAALTRYAQDRAAPWADAAAENTARLLLDVHLVSGRILRVSRNGAAGPAAGVLEDQAGAALAFLARARVGASDNAAAGSRDSWLIAARTVLDTVAAHFVDESGRFHDTADDAEQLAYRTTDITDGPTPSGTALAVEAMRQFEEITGDDVFADQVWRALAASATVIAEHSRFAAGLATVAERLVGETADGSAERMTGIEPA